MSLDTLDLKSLKSLRLKIEGKTLKMRAELRPRANDIFRSVGMRAPNRMIENNLDPVVQRLN